MCMSVQVECVWAYVQVSAKDPITATTISELTDIERTLSHLHITWNLIRQVIFIGKLTYYNCYMHNTLLSIAWSWSLRSNNFNECAVLKLKDVIPSCRAIPSL